MSNARMARQWLWQRSELRRLGRGAWPLGLFLCLGAGFERGAAADPIWLRTSWVQLDTDLSVDREVIDTRWSSVVRASALAPEYSLSSQTSMPSWNGLYKTKNYIEVYPTRLSASNPQISFRPQLVLGGGSSESLRSWLRVVGFNVTSCIAPVMRMHSSFADSNTHANVSVSARCSFH
jgi:hypothetical protein